MAEDYGHYFVQYVITVIGSTKANEHATSMKLFFLSVFNIHVIHLTNFFFHFMMVHKLTG